LAQVAQAGRQAKENVDAQFKAGAEYAKLKQQAEEIGDWVKVGRILSSADKDQWCQLQVEVVQHLLMVVLRWAEADDHDVEVWATTSGGEKNILLKYQPLRLSDVVSWAWSGLPRH